MVRIVILAMLTTWWGGQDGRIDSFRITGILSVEDDFGLKRVGQHHRNRWSKSPEQDGQDRSE
ncbi:hypothetical protein [Pararhodonellum marinum]|uniref:hypothetical protein n=1 Tax=Pararhodonellum marinum TaxID=2755358 RepID=UPI0018900AFA|nr:hypothetical protein [Pararhodonellum marinum]